MSSKYRVVEEDYDNLDVSFHDAYDTTTEFKKEIEGYCSRLPQKAQVLNIGGTAVECEYFISKGFDVTNIDLSQKMVDHIAELSKQTQSIKANIKTFNSDSLYDGVWACRSLIHIPPSDLVTVLRNVHKLLTNDGFFGAVFFSTELDHVVEEEIPEKHSVKNGTNYYRALYPKEILLDQYRKAGLTPMYVVAIEDIDGDKGWFVLAQHTFVTKLQDRDWVFGAWLNRIERIERIMNIDVGSPEGPNEFPYDVAYILFPLLDAISFNLFSKSARTYLSDMQKRYGDIGLSNKEADLLIKIFRNGMTHTTHMSHLYYHDGDIGWGLSSGAGSGGIRQFDFGYTSEEYPEDNLAPETVFEYLKFEGDVYHASLNLERLIALVRDDLKKRQSELPDEKMPFIVGRREEGSIPDAQTHETK
jgi:SAM-dependent methyltransferase